MKYVPFVCLLLATFLNGCASSPRDWGLVREIWYPDAITEPKRLGENNEGERFDHAALGRVLHAVVLANGQVDYGALAKHKDALNQYVALLADVGIDRLSRYEQAAFYVNAYNACTLALMLEHPGIASIREIPKQDRWKAKRWNLGGQIVSLDAMEHEILRPRYFDPRLHMTLVCASEGCPPLRGEPYTGARFLEQLNDQSRRFLSNPKNLRLDAENNILYVSELLDWFRDDFGGEDGIVRFVITHASVFRDLPVPTRVEYLKYNWELNGTW